MPRRSPLPTRLSGSSGGGPMGSVTYSSSATTRSSRVGQLSSGGGSRVLIRRPLSVSARFSTVRVLVTGGGGYLGSEVVRRANARGWDVRATWRTRRPPLAAEWIRVDVRDKEAMRRAADGVDVVVHTAYRQRDEAWSTNADGSHAVAAAARRARLIHLSSDVVFRGDRGRYREDDAPDPVNEYGRSKAAAERVVRGAHPEALVVRTSLLYGRRDPGPQERLAREGAGVFSPSHS